MKAWFGFDLSHCLCWQLSAGSVLGAHPWAVGVCGACKQTGLEAAGLPADCSCRHQTLLVALEWL